MAESAPIPDNALPFERQAPVNHTRAIRCVVCCGALRSDLRAERVCMDERGESRSAARPGKDARGSGDHPRRVIRGRTASPPGGLSVSCAGPRAWGLPLGMRLNTFEIEADRLPGSTGRKPGPGIAALSSSGLSRARALSFARRGAAREGEATGCRPRFPFSEGQDRG